MLKRSLLFSGLLLAASLARAQWVDKISDPVDYVNPLMGTQSTPELSNGNTYPTIALPWGMNFWTPQTGKMGDGWQYTYTADKIRGFKQTHQPSPWMNDYGEFSIMPETGLHLSEDSRASWFSHKAEIVKPYYYSVYLADYDLTTEIVPTERAARFRFTFPRTDSAFVVVDAYNHGSYIKVIPSENKIVGFSTRNSGGVPKNFRNYFVIVFDRPFSSVHTWKDDGLSDSAELTNKHVGAVAGFTGLQRGDIVNARVASSFISIDQAEQNLKEIGADDFGTLVRKDRAIWNKTLGRVAVEGGTIDQVRTFYSCLYRMLFFPLALYERDATGRIVHYSPYNGQVEPGYMFGGTGFWDTFRALYPFLNLLYPDVNQKMQEGLVNDYREGGWLPEWSSPGYRSVMVDELKVYASRAMNYKNLYDPLHKLMRGKNQDGSWQSPFNPFKWGDAFTEGNSWHYTWGVFHDIQGLIDLMGGKKEFVAMLDSIFVMPPTFDDSCYGEVIHEIREMQIAGMGQYAHGNQPIQYMLYLYDYAGEPWKGQYWIRETMNKMYRATPDGYCGDEDNGQTSAWYVFSALGFYSVCPATDQYALGAPLFQRVTLRLINGKTFVIDAPGNGPGAPYVRNVTLNGVIWDKNWIAHSVMLRGGEIRFTMGSTPNKGRGVGEAAAPYSFSRDEKRGIR